MHFGQAEKIYLRTRSVDLGRILTQNAAAANAARYGRRSAFKIRCR